MLFSEERKIVPLNHTVFNIYTHSAIELLNALPCHRFQRCFPRHYTAGVRNSFPGSSLLIWRAAVIFSYSFFFFALLFFSHFWCRLKYALTAPSTSLRIFDPSVFIHYWLCLPKGKLSAGSQNSELFNTRMQTLISDRCWSLGTTEGELRHWLGKLPVQTHWSCRCPGSVAERPQRWEKCLVQGQLPKYTGFLTHAPASWWGLLSSPAS